MIEVYLTVSREKACDSYSRHYSKIVAWPCPPPRDEVIFVGKSEEDGKGAGINAMVKRVGFSSDGSITVEAEVTFCREEFEGICASVELDGFVLLYERTQ